MTTQQNQLSSEDYRQIVREEVRNIMINEMLPKFMPTGSILPVKIRPVLLDGTEPVDGAPLKYDKPNGVVTF